MLHSEIKHLDNLLSSQSIKCNSLLPPPTVIIKGWCIRWWLSLYVLGVSLLCSFIRHDVMAQENGLQVQVRNIRLGVATYWSLEKFEDKLAAMKDAYEVCLSKSLKCFLLLLWRRGWGTFRICLYGYHLIACLCRRKIRACFEAQKKYFNIDSHSLSLKWVWKYK